jgi:hypothetical protein
MALRGRKDIKVSDRVALYEKTDWILHSRYNSTTRPRIQKEAIEAAHEKLPEDEREIIDNAVHDLRLSIKDAYKKNPQSKLGQAGPSTVLEIIGALGIFLEKDAVNDQPNRE